jgi:hypothetical protein
VLTILLSMAVSLSRYVRARSARLLTTDILSRLDRLATLYAARYGGAYPPVTPMPDLERDGTLDDRSARAAAAAGNRDFLRALARDPGSRDWADYFSDLPLYVYDPGRRASRSASASGAPGDGLETNGGSGPSVRDPWGTPIAFIPRQNSAYGMAPRDEPFFVSAGPDHKFSTRGDNVYSYEVVSKTK